MLRKEINIHHARVGEKRHGIKALPVRYTSAGTDIDKYLLGLEHVAVDLDTMRINKLCVPANQVYIFHPLQPICDALVRGASHLILACFHPPHVDRDIAFNGNAETLGLMGQVGNPGAAYQRFRWGTSDIDARATYKLALYYGCLETFLIQSTSKRRTGLAGTDDNCIIIGRHYRLLKFLCRRQTSSVSCVPILPVDNSRQPEAR